MPAHLLWGMTSEGIALDGVGGNVSIYKPRVEAVHPRVAVSTEELRATTEAEPFGVSPITEPDNPVPGTATEGLRPSIFIDDED